MSTENVHDVVLVGGGLANVLIALRLQATRPELRWVLLERGPTLGGNHTWSFHDTDVTDAQRAWLAPLVQARWDRQEVRFPALRRVLSTGYNSISSEGLHAHASRVAGERAVLGAEVREVGPDRVVVEGGGAYRAACVIDGRGALRQQPLAVGYQKFLGLEVHTTRPHGQEWPILMDATVRQHDGYRFVYSLPFSPTRLLIEDTYYSSTPAVETQAVEERIRAYLAERGLEIERVLRTESAVLPITLAGDVDAHWQLLGDEVPRVGLRAWLFHPTTGYSLPMAAAVADGIARQPELRSRALAPWLARLARREWRRQRLYRFLNRMLFLAARPSERVQVLQRFYALPEPLIRRFYAGRPTPADWARILIGRPPLSVWRAMRVLSERRAWHFAASQLLLDLG